MGKLIAPPTSNTTRVFPDKAAEAPLNNKTIIEGGGGETEKAAAEKGHY